MAELPCPLAAAARRSGESPAVIGPSGFLTYREYDARASAVAARLRREGFKPGERLAFLLPPSPEYLVWIMGCFRAGVVACPLNARLPEQGVRAAVELAQCRALVTDRAETSGLPRLDPAFVPAAPETGKADPAIPADRPAVVIFTSGSTGLPKAALLAYGNLYHNARASNRNIRMEPNDRWLLSLPLYHVSGLGVMFRCLLAGATVVIPEARAALEDGLKRHGVTHASLVTTQLQRLLDDPAGADALRNLKAILLGGSAMSPGLIRRALKRGAPIHTSYGLTEMASQVATTTPEDRAAGRLDSAPPLIPGSLRLAETGEILVSGPTLFLGYLKEGEVVRPLTPDGWFPTGDLGRLDPEGRLQVIGRRDNLFISGGENIHPEEIERALCRAEGVLQALVVPVEHPEYGQRPVAFVRTASGEPPDAPALRAALVRSLPAYKLPDAFLPWPAHLERPGQKLNRREFAAEARRLTGEGKTRSPADGAEERR